MIRWALVLLLLSANAFGRSDDSLPGPFVWSQEQQELASRCEIPRNQKECSSEASPLFVERVESRSDREERDEISKDRAIHATNERRIVSATIALAAITGVLAVFTALLWLSTKRLAQETAATGVSQLAITKQSADSAEKTAKALLAQVRPTLSLKIEATGPMTIAADFLALTVSPRVKNIGASAAIDVQFGMFHVPAKQQRWTMRELILNEVGAVIANSVGQTLLPGDSLSEICSVSQRFDFEREGMVGRGALDFIFWVSYRSVFGDDGIHFTAKHFVTLERGADSLFVTPARTGVVETGKIVLMPISDLLD